MTNKPRPYYTLCVWDVAAQAWFDDFGDYKKADVITERDDHYARAGHKTIIVTDGSRDDLIAKRNALPEPKRPY